MQTEKKPDAPDYFFCDVVTELQALVDEDDERFAIYEALALGNVDNKWLDVGAFCVAPQPTFNDLTIDTLVDGSWTQELQNCALASVFFRLCREVQTEMIQSATFALTSEQLNAFTLVNGQQVATPQQILAAGANNKIRLPVGLLVNWNPGLSGFDAAPLMKVKQSGALFELADISNPCIDLDPKRSFDLCTYHQVFQVVSEYGPTTIEPAIAGGCGTGSISGVILFVEIDL